MDNGLLLTQADEERVLFEEGVSGLVGKLAEYYERGKFDTGAEEKLISMYEALLKKDDAELLEDTAREREKNLDYYTTNMAMLMYKIETLELRLDEFRHAAGLANEFIRDNIQHTYIHFFEHKLASYREDLLKNHHWYSICLLADKNELVKKKRQEYQKGLDDATKGLASQEESAEHYEKMASGFAELYEKLAMV